MAQAGQANDGPLTGYAEVTAAFQIVRQVRKQNLKWLPELFNTILYENTELARPTPRVGHVGENEILMKNVYYLATKTKNVNDGFVIILIDSDVLTVEEGNLIKNQPTCKLKAVKLYALLIEKEDPDRSIADTVIALLQESDNFEVVEIFAQHVNFDDLRAPNQGRNEQPNLLPIAPGGDAMQNPDNLEVGNWACRYCTFINNANTNICEVCSKTVDFNLNDSMEVNICPQCTLMNEDGARACEACGFIFVQREPQQEGAIANPVHPQDSDEDSDSDVQIE